MLGTSRHQNDGEAAEQLKVLRNAASSGQSIGPELSSRRLGDDRRLHSFPKRFSDIPWTTDRRNPRFFPIRYGRATREGMGHLPWKSRAELSLFKICSHLRIEYKLKYI